MITHTLTICFHKNFPFQLHIKDVPRSKQQTQGGILPDCTVTATHFSQEVIHTQCKKKLPQPHSRTVPISEHYNVKVYMNHGQIVKMCWFKCILSLLRKINDSSKWTPLLSVLILVPSTTLHVEPKHIPSVGEERPTTGHSTFGFLLSNLF